jgi:hypothetical protein
MVDIEDRYAILDVSEILAKQEDIFIEFRKEFPFSRYNDLYEIVLLSFWILPTHNVGHYDVVRDRIIRHYYYDFEKISSSYTFDLLIENTYASILDAIDKLFYDKITLDQYEPDYDTIIAIKFLTPKMILLRITREELYVA